MRPEKEVSARSRLSSSGSGLLRASEQPGHESLRLLERPAALWLKVAGSPVR